MVNIDDFIKRLETILDFYSLNASSFADKIGVQRSSMSHLLSGRNKPSLDFVMKILEVFPEIDLYWILNGTGDFPKKEDNLINHTKEIKPLAPIQSNETFEEQNLFSKINFEKESDEVKMNDKIENNNSKKTDEIEKIVFFYKNGTFKVYMP
jgi:transcriptional regulator with XRE-family HTH domain